MSDLTEWLLACIAEDESVAEDVRFQAMRGRPFIEIQAGGTGVRRLTDPDHWLAVCKAHREIVEAAREYSPELEHGDNGEWAFDFTIRALATIYADRPGWREEWAS